MLSSCSCPGALTGTPDVKRIFRTVAPLMWFRSDVFPHPHAGPTFHAGSILIVSVVMVMLAGARWLHLGLLARQGADAGDVLRPLRGVSAGSTLLVHPPLRLSHQRGLPALSVPDGLRLGRSFRHGPGMGRQKSRLFAPTPSRILFSRWWGRILGLVGLRGHIGAVRGVRVLWATGAIRCRGPVRELLAGGITAMIGVSVDERGGVTGLMPTTGLPLPFFSSGGTSIAIAMAAVAVVLNISRSGGGSMRTRTCTPNEGVP
jgi:hypothetical protein